MGERYWFTYLATETVPPLHTTTAGSIEKRLPSTTPQGQVEQTGRDTRAEKREGAAGKLNLDGGWK